MYKTSITGSHRLNGTGLGRSPRRSKYVVCGFDLRCTPTSLTRDVTLTSGDGAKRTCRYEGNAHLTALSRVLRGERDLQKCFGLVASAELTKGTTIRASTLADLEGSEAGTGIQPSALCRTSKGPSQLGTAVLLPFRSCAELPHCARPPLPPSCDRRDCAPCWPQGRNDVPARFECGLYPQSLP